MNSTNSYVSLFKINGVPILPPLITDEICAEMNHYKMLAVALEQQLQNKDNLNNSEDDATNDELPSESSYFNEIENELCTFLDMKLNTGSIKNNNLVEKENVSDYIKVSSMMNQSASHQLIESAMNTSHSIPSGPDLEDLYTINNTSALVNLEKDSTNQNSPLIKESALEYFDASVDEHLLISNNNYIVDKINIDIATDRDHEITSIITKEKERPRLIRSNSYTLENPSQLLVKHMESKGVDMNASYTIKSKSACVSPFINKSFNPNTTYMEKSNKSRPLIRKAKPKIILPSANKNSIIYKQQKGSNENLRSTSALINLKKGSQKKATSKRQIFKVMKNENTFEKKIPSHLCCKMIYDPNGVQYKTNNQNNNAVNNEAHIIDVLTKAEIEYKNQMTMLMQQQQIEQRKMQESFMQQQEMLVRQITQNYSNIFNSSQISSSSKNGGDFINESMKEDDTNKPMSINLYPSMKTVQYDDKLNNNESSVQLPQLPQNLTFYQQIVPSTVEPFINSYHTQDRDTWTLEADVNSYTKKKSNSTTCIKRLFKENGNVGTKSDMNDSRYAVAKIAAATTINAYTRGYLVRRLFKTESVQIIVKIIRDTLLFVLDLHDEIKEKESLADIKLKRSLLQQLNTACYSLYDIFFRRTIVEQMEIISTDRKLVHNKIIRSKSNSSSLLSSSSDKMLNKLEKIALFPINISGRKTKNSKSQTSVMQNTVSCIILPRRPKSNA